MPLRLTPLLFLPIALALSGCTTLLGGDGSDKRPELTCKRWGPSLPKGWNGEPLWIADALYRNGTVYLSTSEGTYRIPYPGGTEWEKLNSDNAHSLDTAGGKVVSYRYRILTLDDETGALQPMSNPDRIEFSRSLSSVAEFGGDWYTTLYHLYSISSDVFQQFEEVEGGNVLNGIAALFRGRESLYLFGNALSDSSSGVYSLSLDDRTPRPIRCGGRSVGAVWEEEGEELYILSDDRLDRYTLSTGECRLLARDPWLVEKINFSDNRYSGKMSRIGEWLALTPRKGFFNLRTGNIAWYKGNLLYDKLWAISDSIALGNSDSKICLVDLSELE